MVHTATVPRAARAVRVQSGPPRPGPGDGAGQASAYPPYLPDAAEAHEVETLRARDPEALERLVLQQSDRLYSVIFRLVRDPDETRNLVQETFLQALRSLPSFKGTCKVSTWLYSIAMNVTMSHLRKVRRRRVLSEADIEQLQPRFTQQGDHVAHVATWNPEAALERRDRARLVRRALDRLPEEYRAIVVMRDLEELSTTEVAQALKISEGNVRVRLHRARNVLRRMLAPYFAAADVSAVRV